MFQVTYIRMERQTGSVNVEADNIEEAERAARKELRYMRQGRGRGPESWETDANGHKLSLAAVEHCS